MALSTLNVSKTTLTHLQLNSLDVVRYEGTATTAG